MEEHAPASAGRATAAIYLRVSTKEQAVRHGDAEGYSLPTQRADAQRMAASLDADVVEEFIDKDTGTSTDKRPAMQRLLAWLQDGHHVDYVIVFKLDRWARNVRDDLNADFVLEMAGAKLVSCSERIDRTAAGRLLHSMLASVNEYQSRNMSDDIKRKTLAKAIKGGTPFQAPIGYLNKQDGIDVRYIAVDPERAPHVTWAFEAYADGNMTVLSLAEALKGRGMTTRATKKRLSKPMSANGIQSMLRNPYYMGIVRYRGTDYAGTHEPLVSPEVWFKVQDVLDAKRQGEKSRAHPHYLKGTLFCGNCGSRLCVSYSRGRGGTYAYYFCIGRHQRRTNCTLRARPLHIVEEAVEDHYRQMKWSAELLDELRPALLAELSDRRHELDAAQAQQRRQIGQLEDERRKMLQLHYADALPADLFKDEQVRISRALSVARTALERAVVDIERADETLKQALAFAANCDVAYLDAPPQVRRQMNQALFKAIWVNEEGISRCELAEPFASLVSYGNPGLTGALEAETLRRLNDEETPTYERRGSKETLLVEVMGFEPTASSMRPRRSSQLSYTPVGIGERTGGGRPAETANAGAS